MKRVSETRGLSLALTMALLLVFSVPVLAAPGGQPSAGSLNPDGPTITVWHGTTQNFGVHGDPQLWINILGNVQGANSLQYSLNGAKYVDVARAGGSRSATLALDDADWHPGGLAAGPAPEFDVGGLDPQVLGPDELAVTASRRLVSSGDFNIEINPSDLLPGQNTVLIRANNDNDSVETVTVNYSAGNTWPLPYTIDWSQVSDIADVAQVVDGQWQLQADGIRPSVLGYDRVVAIGDLDWQDYDVLVPITIHRFPEEDVGGVGVVARWLGHFQVDDEQPGAGWWNIGAYGLWRNRFDNGQDRSKLWMYTGHYDIVKDDSGFMMDLDVPYNFRMRVQTKKAGGGFYSFRVWEAGRPEPSGWTFEVQDNKPEGWQPGEPREAPSTGSVLLVAHEADATFGDMEISPLLDLDVSTVGSGSVQVTPELEGASDAYLYGDMVRLEAQAGPGLVFSGWSGGLTSAQNPVTLTLTADTEVVATFGPPRSLDIGIDGQGSVARDPDLEEYGEGAVVMLRPIPAAGWAFMGWSGPNGDEPEEHGSGVWSLLMDGDKTMTALFSPVRIFLPVVNRSR
jgi:hypothetical protein